MIQIFMNHHHHHECSAQGQVHYCKRRNLGCSSTEGRCCTANSANKTAVTRYWIGAVASRCFQNPTLSLGSEKTLKGLKRSQGHQREHEEWIWLPGPSGLHRKSPQGLNISSIRVFDQIRDPETPITLRPIFKNIIVYFLYNQIDYSLSVIHLNVQIFIMWLIHQF